MPYTNVVFTPSSPIDGEAIEDAISSLRRYTNRGIDAADFLSNVVLAEDILEGDPVGATRTDYWAVSGDVHAQYGNSARVNRMYLTGTATIEADYNASYLIDQSLPGCSKKFVVEREALVVTTVWFMTILGESNLSSNTINPESYCLMYKNDFSPVHPSVTPFFVEDSAIAAPNSGPQPPGSAMNRRPLSFTWVETLHPGTYFYRFFVTLKSEKMFVSARSMTIEVLYL